ncbi:MAG: hypothetical protein H7Z42_12815 [Roseiflexaceae bacterium]|nr:hypothetical protein [Roseiflexaceae bacterium]
MQNPMIDNLVQFMHVEKLYSYFPGMNEALMAQLLGLDGASYRAIKGRFDANARAAAQELLADPAFAARVDQLPFRAGDTVVGIGDSFTDDLQSWLEIVRHLLDLRRPHDAVRIVNEGLSAHTSAMVLRRFVPMLLAQKPNWIICFLGGNDVTRIGAEPNKPQVSLEETTKNLEALRRIAATQTKGEWIWMTLPTFVEERAAVYPPFTMGQSYWRNADVLPIGEYIRAQPELVVDIQSVFGLPANPDFLGPDGVHPSLAGQKAIARALVERLTQ